MNYTFPLDIMYVRLLSQNSVCVTQRRTKITFTHQQVLNLLMTHTLAKLHGTVVPNLDLSSTLTF